MENTEDHDQEFGMCLEDPLEGLRLYIISSF